MEISKFILKLSFIPFAIILLLGFTPQNSIAKYIALADICINPFEINQITNRILPTKILEYLACKKPVVSTPLNGTKEILLDENFGVIYATKNNFIEKLVLTLKNKEEMEKIGTAGYLYIKEHHDWKKLSTQVLEKIQYIQFKD